MFRFYGLALPAFLLSACDPTGVAGGIANTVNASKAEANSAMVAPASTTLASALTCASLPASDGKRDNDIMNIDMGMTADDAIRVAKCNKEGLAVDIVEAESLTLPDGTHPRSMIEMKKDGDLVRAFLVGLPGQEKVVGLVRVRAFTEGQEPVLDQMRQQLADKYGPLLATFQTMDGTDPNQLAQAFTPTGQSAPNNRVGDKDCAEIFGQNSDLGQLDEVCGFTKKISVTPKYGNNELASGFSVWIGDQNGYFVQARQTAIVVHDLFDKARAAERNKAASSNRVPTL